MDNQNVPLWLEVCNSAENRMEVRLAFRKMKKEIDHHLAEEQYSQIGNMLHLLALSASDLDPMLLIAGLRLTCWYDKIEEWSSARDGIAKALDLRRLDSSVLLRGLFDKPTEAKLEPDFVLMGSDLKTRTLVRIALEEHGFIVKEQAGLPHFSDRLDWALNLLSTHYDLTNKEFDVLYMMLLGYSNAQISHYLGIKLTTTKTHVAQILHKADAVTRTQILKPLLHAK